MALARLSKRHDDRTDFGSPPDRGGRKAYARDQRTTRDHGKCTWSMSAKVTSTAGPAGHARSPARVPSFTGAIGAGNCTCRTRRTAGARRTRTLSVRPSSHRVWGLVTPVRDHLPYTAKIGRPVSRATSCGRCSRRSASSHGFRSVRGLLVDPLVGLDYPLSLRGRGLSRYVTDYRGTSH